MKYKIDWVETNKYGKQEVAVTGEDGSKILKAELGKEYTTPVMAGQELFAKDWKSPKNGKVYLFMDKAPIEGETPRKSTYNPKNEAIKEAQNTKRQDINNSMDRKEEGISLSAAQRDAVLIVTEIYGKTIALDENNVKEEIIKWRNWFLSDDFKNHPPF